MLYKITVSNDESQHKNRALILKDTLDSHENFPYYRINNLFFTPLKVKKGQRYAMSKKSNISVYVSSNVERALKQLKKKIEREGVVRDMKRTVYFESPTQKRRKRLVRAIKQNLMRMITNKPN